MADFSKRGEQLRLFDPDLYPSPDDGRPIIEHVDFFAEDDEEIEPVVLENQLSLFYKLGARDDR